MPTNSSCGVHVKNKKWYRRLLERIDHSYNDHILVLDQGNLLEDVELLRELERSFVVCFYGGEIKLRALLKQNKDRRVIIIKRDNSYFPHDIEECVEIIVFSKKDIEKPTSNVFPDRYYDLAHLEERVEDLLKKGTISWLELAPLWGELAYKSQKGKSSRKILTFEDTIQTKFTTFILEQYSDLFFRGYLINPVTVDRVMPFLSHQEVGKKALICFDGMGFQEWYCLKEFLGNMGINNFRETSVFALLPSLTSISRCSLLTGEKCFERFTTETKGFPKFIREHWPNGERKTIELFIKANPMTLMPVYFEYEYVGIIFNLIDKIAHATQGVLDNKLIMLNNLRQILPETEIPQIIVRFLEEDYRVFITSDHGSVWCEGIGLKPSKYMVEEKAKRVALFPNKILAREFLEKDEKLIEFEHKDTLGNSIAVFPPGHKMYGKTDHRAISHGGIHMEEVIIPFVEIIQ